jgi:hypothetical protein
MFNKQNCKKLQPLAALKTTCKSGKTVQRTPRSNGCIWFMDEPICTPSVAMPLLTWKLLKVVAFRGLDLTVWDQTAE